MAVWRNLSERERLLIKIAAALFAVFAAVQFIVRPIADWRADRHRALEEAQGLYTLVNEAGALAVDLAPATGDDQTPIRTALAQTASAAGINLIYVNVRPDGAVDANLADVDPERLFDWLQAVERDYGARVVAADIVRERTQTGAVRAQLTFDRRGGP